MSTADRKSDDSDFSDSPAEQHDEVAADEDARRADRADQIDDPGAVGLLPAPNSPAGAVALPADEDPDGVDHRRD